MDSTDTLPAHHNYFQYLNCKQQSWVLPDKRQLPIIPERRTSGLSKTLGQNPPEFIQAQSNYRTYPYTPHHPHSPQEMKRSREPEDNIDSDSEVSHPEVSIRPVSKYAGLDLTNEQDGIGANDAAMRCFLPPHKEPLSFRSYEEYESHYQKFHAHRCLDCRKNFPSQHLLGVHIEECHDPLVAVKRDRGDHTVGVHHLPLYCRIF